jgi:hypothetical protein
MRFSLYGLAPVLLVVLGCGGSSKAPPHNDAGSVSEAGVLDGATSADGRRADGKTGIDVPVTEAGAVRDTKATPIDGADRDARDSRPAVTDAKRDVPQDVDNDPDVPVDPPAPLGTCASPIEIPYTTHIDLTADTTGAEHALDFPCAANGADIVFKVRSDGNELVYADTFGTTWNTALFFSDACDLPSIPKGDGMAACNDDACGTTQSQAFATLEYGFHYLIVSGVGTAVGPLKLHYERGPLGNGVPANLPAGTATLTGTTAGSDSTRTCDMAGPKNSYWWITCPADLGGPFHATSCNGATWDAALILQIPRLADSPLCADDDQACGMQATLDGTIPPGAGIAILSVTGNLMRSLGDYVVTYTRP